MPELVRSLCGVQLSYVGWGTTPEELAYCSSAVRSLRDQGCTDGEIVAGLMSLVGEASAEAPAACAENHAAVYRRLLVILLGLIPAARVEGSE